LIGRDQRQDDYLGFGSVHFMADDTGRFTSGRGSYLDAGAELAKGQIALERIEKEHIMNILGKPSISSDKEREDYVKARLELRARGDGEGKPSDEA
jgi:hypothetical protein